MFNMSYNKQNLQVTLWWIKPTNSISETFYVYNETVRHLKPYAILTFTTCDKFIIICNHLIPPDKWLGLCHIAGRIIIFILVSLYGTVGKSQTCVISFRPVECSQVWTPPHPVRLCIIFAVYQNMQCFMLWYILFTGCWKTSIINTFKKRLWHIKGTNTYRNKILKNCASCL